MASLAIRDPVADYLLTPGNSALLIIDDQPVQAIREGFEVSPVDSNDRLSDTRVGVDQRGIHWLQSVSVRAATNCSGACVAEYRQ